MILIAKSKFFFTQLNKLFLIRNIFIYSLLSTHISLLAQLYFDFLFTTFFSKVSISSAVFMLVLVMLSSPPVSYIVSSPITNLTYSVLSILPCSIMGNLICYRSYHRLNVTIVSKMIQHLFMS